MVRFAISENLKDKGFSLVEASSGREALTLIKKEKPVSVILDLNMPGMSGLETLTELKKIDPDIPIIINTAHGDIPTAVEAIKLGAFEFITKPPNYDRLTLTLNRAAEKFAQEKKIQRLSSEVETSLEYLLGKSPAIKKVIQQIHQIAYSDFSLILQGETGTGKSFIARAIHNLSKRTNGPFVSIDIGTLPETLIESELFGYEKGAFTGAEKKKKGYFEIADKGTILIDELQNLSPYVQSKLLKVVEEKSLVPLGGNHSFKTDVRIIGATNTDIIKSVKEKKNFREDLFYRLSEFIIQLPPLRERSEDIQFFADKFFRETAEDLDKQIQSISKKAMTLLTNYSWPGNIRELKNVIRRAVLLSEENTIRPENIEFLIDDTAAVTTTKHSVPTEALPALSLADAEKAAIIKSMEFTGNNKTKAASILKIDYTTLLRKIKQYGI